LALPCSSFLVDQAMKPASCGATKTYRPRPIRRCHTLHRAGVGIRLAIRDEVTHQPFDAKSETSGILRFVVETEFCTDTIDTLQVGIVL